MIHVRTRAQYGAVFALMPLAAAAVLLARAAYATVLLLPWLWAICSPRAAFIAARRAIKPAALRLNAERYKASEEEIDYLRGTQRRLRYLALDAGRDAGYYARYRLHLSAKEHRELVLQWKLRARRDQINQW